MDKFMNNKQHVTQKKSNQNTKNTSAFFMGFGLLLLFTFLSYAISRIPQVAHLAISPLIISVVIGAVVGNSSRKVLVLLQHSGALQISTKQILRLGIILYGFRLTFQDIAHVGITGLLIASVVVVSTFFIGAILGRAMGIDDKSSILISAGSSICGAAAVLATESVVQGKSDRVGVAVSTVVVFGTIGMFVYPVLYSTGFFSFGEKEMGFLVGGTLHEVAHVVGAGAAISPITQEYAVIIKMIRVLILVPALTLLGLTSPWWSGEKRQAKGSIPWFALWFLVASALASFSFFPKQILPAIHVIDTLLLTIAMAALGVQIHKDQLVASGKKPFILAGVLSLWLGFIGHMLVGLLL